MPFKYHIRQAKPFRTRVQFAFFRNQPDCCVHMEKKLSPVKGVVKVQVRSKSGSVILLHPDRAIAVETILDMVEHEKKALKKIKQKFLKKRLAAKNFSSGHHVSGKLLIVSGIYILYLMIKRVFLPLTETIVTRIISIPFFLTIFLAFPIQRNAIDNYKTTGKMDMGMISTALLYISLLTGNILTALMISWLFNLSGWMETRIKERARKTIREMLTGKSTKVWQIIDNVEIETDIKDISPGNTIVLLTGDSIPVDGTITKGSALINEASMTGENLPASRTCDDSILAGTIVIEGRIFVRVDKTGEDTRLAAIIRFIETAQTDIGDLGRLSLKFSQAMVPVSIGLAVFAFILTGNLLQAVTIIMITCPCAIRLSTSVAISVAMGNAANNGILIKGGSYVETCGKTNVLVLDKTGTLTGSESKVSKIDIIDKRFKENSILRFGASVLKTFPHPLSRAITLEAQAKGLKLLTCQDTQRLTGKGATATVQDKTLQVGSFDFMEECGINETKPKSFSKISNSRHLDKFDESIVFVAINYHLIGFIHVQNVMRDDVSLKTIKKIRQSGIHYIAILTGDSSSGVKGLQEKLLVDEVQWKMSPEDKADWIKKRKTAHPHEVIAMAGDGINDTPAFAFADLSFAIGDSGSDATVEYADIVLQKGGIGQVAKALEIGSETLNVIKQSYAIAISLNITTLGLMMAGFISPLGGALLHNLITAVSVANAAKLVGKKRLPKLPTK